MAKNTAFTRAVKKAKGLYKTGRYSTFADAVKAAYKKPGKVGTAKRKKPKPYQTGKSNAVADRSIKARPPGKRKSKSGRVYTERRKNRSDMPGKLTGVTAINTRSLDTLNKLVRDLAVSKAQFDFLKLKKRRGDKLSLVERSTLRQYPGYIKSLNRQISDTKRNIR